jgi:hypothetical protein
MRSTACISKTLLLHALLIVAAGSARLLVALFTYVYVRCVIASCRGRPHTGADARW